MLGAAGVLGVEVLGERQWVAVGLHCADMYHGSDSFLLGNRTACSGWAGRPAACMPSRLLPAAARPPPLSTTSTTLTLTQSPRLRAGYGNWYDAPLPLVQGGNATYFGATVPFDLGTLAGVEFALMVSAAEDSSRSACQHPAVSAR